MWFHYRARRKDGTTDAGYLEATGLQQAKDDLKSRYVAILELKIEDSKNAPSKKRIKIKSDLLVGFYRRLPTMLGAGLALASSLEFLAQSEADPNLSEAIELISRGVAGGQRLSNAMSHPRIADNFPKVVLGMVALGENTGALVDTLTRVADLAETQQRLRRTVMSALTYPAFLFLGIIAMTMFFTLVLAPGDKSLFASLGGELPLPTRMLIAFGDFLRNPFLMGGSLALLVGGVLLFRWRLQRDEFLRSWVDTALLRLPIVGELVSKTISAQMLYVISTGLQVGMAISSALFLARDVCTNTVLRQRFDKALAGFKDGEDLAEVLAQHEVFPMMVTSMVQMGMEVGNLELILGRISVMYEEDVTQALATATQLAEPFLLAFAGALSAFLALGTLLPIINVVNQL